MSAMIRLTMRLLLDRILFKLIADTILFPIVHKMYQLGPDPPHVAWSQGWLLIGGKNVRSWVRGSPILCFPVPRGTAMLKLCPVHTMGQVNSTIASWVRETMLLDAI